MATHISHASLPYPIKNARFTLLTAFLDADGDPTDPTTPDTEVSQDGGAFADAAEEVTTIAGSNGMGFVTLTGAETNNSAVAVAFKVASGPKATLAALYPRNLPTLSSGTLSAGSAGGGTLGTVLAYDITGCFIRTTGGTGGGGAGGANNQGRRIATYTLATGAFTVTPNWETTADATTTYDILCPEGVTPGMLKALNPTTAGRTLDVDANGGAEVGSFQAGAITNAAFAAGAIDATAIATDAIGAAEIADGAITAAAFAAGAIDATAIAVDAIGASELATGAVDKIAAAILVTPANKLATASTGSPILRTSESTMILSSTAQAGGASTITLNTGASAVNDFYKGAMIFLHSGTGALQSGRIITAYDGTTKVATVDRAWATAPDATSLFAIHARPGTALDTNLRSPNLDAAISSRASQTSVDTIDDFLDTEVAAILAAVDTEVAAIISTLGAAGAGLTAVPWNAAWDAEVQSEVEDALAAARSESAAVPAANASLIAKITWLATLARNKIEQTATTQTVRADDGTTAVATSTVSDDGTTAIRGEFT